MRSSKCLTLWSSPIIFLEYLRTHFFEYLTMHNGSYYTQKIYIIRIYFVTIHIHQLRILYIALYITIYCALCLSQLSERRAFPPFGCSHFLSLGTPTSTSGLGVGTSLCCACGMDRNRNRNKISCCYSLGPLSLWTFQHDSDWWTKSCLQEKKERKFPQLSRHN